MAKMHDLFYQIAALIATKSKCISRKTGAIIVNSRNVIISTGYNGTPKKYNECIDGACKRCDSEHESGIKLDYCLCVHAEANAIIQAAQNGISTDSCTLYTTTYPCMHCAKLIINCGIKEVYYIEDYNSQLTAKLFNACKIQCNKKN